MSLTMLPDLAFEFPHSLASEARSQGIVIFGGGSFARDLLRAAREAGITVHGFITSAGPATEHAGLPVLPMTQAPAAWRALPVWIGVFNHTPSANYASIKAGCAAAGFPRVSTPPEFFELVQDALGWRYWLTDRSNYATQREALDAALARLEDEQSRQLLAATLQFRLGRSADIPGAPADEPHYFPAFVRNARPGPLGLVDVGAYDGDTLAAALDVLPLREAWAFEPDPANFERLAARARTFPVPTACFPCGASSTTAMLAFSGAQGEACAIGGAGGMQIQVVKLDDCLPNAHVGYLKFDVEGHEMDALQGALGLIRRNRPILAIAGYHRWDDLWRIPAWVDGLGLDYRLSFRIHTHNSFDAVFYAY